MDRISDIQNDILNFLRERISSGVIPSVREIGAEMGLKSTSTVQFHLDALERAGCIERDPMHKRSIRIVGTCDNVNHVPLLGTVTAGMPILAVEDIEDYIPYSGPISRDKKLFALHVRGDSMINAAILDGDIVIVEQAATAKNGEIVVALINDEATVKRFFKENGHFRLQPENDNYEPIIVSELSLLGRVISVIRYY